MRTMFLMLGLAGCEEDFAPVTMCVELDPTYPCDVFRYCQEEAHYDNGEVEVYNAYWAYLDQRAYCATDSCDGAFYLASSWACNPDWPAGLEDTGDSTGAR